MTKGNEALADGEHARRRIVNADGLIDFQAARRSWRQAPTPCALCGPSRGFTRHDTRVPCIRSRQDIDSHGLRRGQFTGGSVVVELILEVIL